jgi:putative ABC transport system permease protein
VAAVAVALAIGVGAGVYPASRAARLPPIDALRNE